MTLRSIIRFMRREDGNATLEFIIIFPFLMLFFLMLGEVGTLMARYVSLERGLDIAMRDVRLGDPTVSTQQALRARVCREAILVTDCDDTLLIEMVGFNAGGLFGSLVPTGGVTCVDRTSEIDPVVEFNASGPGEIVVVRACAVVDTIFPTTGFLSLLPASRGGGYAVLATSAYIREPD